ncbi:MAG: hypothetical protein ACI4IS_01410 [Acutalibacteraceae bacterium]
MKIKITIMYSTIPPPFSRELKQPPLLLYKYIIAQAGLLYKRK